MVLVPSTAEMTGRRRSAWHPAPAQQNWLRTGSAQLGPCAWFSINYTTVPTLGKASGSGNNLNGPEFQFSCIHNHCTETFGTNKKLVLNTYLLLL